MPDKLIIFIQVFAFILLLFPVMIGFLVRQWQTALRIFLFEVGAFGAFIAFDAALFYLPDELVVPLLLAAAALPWLFIWRYFSAARSSGAVLMDLPYQEETGIWFKVIMLVTQFTMMGFGVSIVIFTWNSMPYTKLPFSIPLLSFAKVCALGLALISLGVWNKRQDIHPTQIGANGILSSSGSFYPWDNIESFTWKFGDDKLALKLKKARIKRSVDLKIRSNFRHEIVLMLEQYMNNGQITA
jgi:hypothetical protein